MTERAAVMTGRFVWHDLMTTDPARSIAFHSALLGWSVEEEAMEGGGRYPVIRAGGVGIGGFVELEREHGVPSHWIGYVTVGDVEKTIAAARAAGGKAPVGATDLPHVGRFAVVSHPGGSFVSPLAPVSLGACIPEAEPVPGRFCWNQLMARDPEAARAFYEATFGWTTDVQELDGGRYWLFRSEGAPTAGMMQSPERRGHPDFWLAYVEVPDVDVSAARVPELGGHVLVRPTNIAGLARFAVAADPTGAILAVSTHGSF
jgi:predicted enzyme related to lactoylglutathione lyase